ncbi:WzyE family oligosaccharide polymerase [Escherichia coli]
MIVLAREGLDWFVWRGLFVVLGAVIAKLLYWLFEAQLKNWWTPKSSLQRPLKDNNE